MLYFAGDFCIIFRCFSILHRVNSKSLWCIKHGKDPKKANTFDVALDRANSLVMPFIQQRSLEDVRKPLLKKINYIKIEIFIKNSHQ